MCTKKRAFQAWETAWTRHRYGIACVIVLRCRWWGERERRCEWEQKGRVLARAELWEYAGTDTLNSINREGYNCGLSILDGEAQESVTVQSLVRRADQSLGIMGVHMEVQVMAMDENVKVVIAFTVTNVASSMSLT